MNTCPTFIIEVGPNLLNIFLGAIAVVSTAVASHQWSQVQALRNGR